MLSRKNYPTNILYLQSDDNMRDLQRYAYLGEAMLDRVKIKYAKNIEYVINSRAQSRLGLCKKLGGKYTVEISSKLLDERVDEQTLIETVLHEQLHTCYGCMKHTGKWKQLAQKVNEAYKLNIVRAADEDCMPEELLPKPKYVIKCQDCGEKFYRQKLSPLVKRPGNYRCGKCGGQLTLIK